MMVLVIPAMPLAAIVGDRWLPRRTWIALAMLALALLSWPLYHWMIVSGGSLASVVTVHPGGTFSPRMSLTENIIVMSLIPTKGDVSPDATVETITFGNP